MKTPEIKRVIAAVAAVQLPLQFPRKKPKQVQMTFRFPKVLNKKLDKFA